MFAAALHRLSSHSQQLFTDVEKNLSSGVCRTKSQLTFNLSSAGTVYPCLINRTQCSQNFRRRAKLFRGKLFTIFTAFAKNVSVVKFSAGFVTVM
jgi:hypothetical protein